MTTSIAADAPPIPIRGPATPATVVACHGRGPWIAPAGHLWRIAVLAVCLLVALVPRFVDIDTVITTDESYWMQRTTRFASALARGDLAGTYRSGHPGVTVMWVGALGIGPERLEPFMPARFGLLNNLERAPGYLDAFGGARRAMALATAAAYVLVVALAWKLLGPDPWPAGCP